MTNGKIVKKITSCSGMSDGSCVMPVKDARIEAKHLAVFDA